MIDLALKSILDWIYPPTCAACRTLIALNDTQPRDMMLCCSCQTLFEPIEPPICAFCGMPTESEVDRCASCFGMLFGFTQNRAAFRYEGVVRDLLLELKFSNNKQIAHALGKLWAFHIAPMSMDSNYILTALPMHKTKQRERGFNQAEVLTQHLSQRLGITMEKALLRIIDTPPQSGLHPRERIQNVDGAFAVAKNIDVSGKNYIIVDDIFTTGASLNACAKALLKSGAAGVRCMTLAIVEKREKGKESGFKT